MQKMVSLKWWPFCLNLNATRNVAWLHQAIIWANIDQDLCCHNTLTRPQWPNHMRWFPRVIIVQIKPTKQAILCIFLDILYMFTRWDMTVNSLTPDRFNWNIRWVIFKLFLVIWWLRYQLLDCPQKNLTNDKSTLVQVMAWCRQATSHYLSQCWPRSMSAHGVTRPLCVKRQ